MPAHRSISRGVQLTALANNLGARRLGERPGFLTIVIERDAVKCKGRVYAEESMALRLGSLISADQAWRTAI